MTHTADDGARVMNDRSAFVMTTASVTLLAGLAGLWFITGGAEELQPPLEIVVPESVSGVVCATSRPGTREDVRHVVRHEVSPDGLLEVDGDVLRSHRPVKVFIRSAAGSTKEIPRHRLTGIFTESDASSGAWHAVMWLGDIKDWTAHCDAMMGKRFCTGRFVGRGGQ